MIICMAVYLSTSIDLLLPSPGGAPILLGDFIATFFIYVSFYILALLAGVDLEQNAQERFRCVMRGMGTGEELETAYADPRFVTRLLYSGDLHCSWVLRPSGTSHLDRFASTFAPSTVSLLKSKLDLAVPATPGRGGAVPATTRDGCAVLPCCASRMKKFHVERARLEERERQASIIGADRSGGAGIVQAWRYFAHNVLLHFEADSTQMLFYEYSFTSLRVARRTFFCISVWSGIQLAFTLSDFLRPLKMTRAIGMTGPPSPPGVPPPTPWLPPPSLGPAPQLRGLPPLTPLTLLLLRLALGVILPMLVGGFWHYTTRRMRAPKNEEGEEGRVRCLCYWKRIAVLFQASMVFLSMIMTALFLSIHLMYEDLTVDPGLHR
jgi:hypothetical protein